MGSAKSGAITLDEMLKDIELPSLEVPEISAPQFSDKSKDLFEEKKRKAWKQLDTAEARCDFSPGRIRMTNRGGRVLYHAVEEVYLRKDADGHQGR